MSADIVRLPRKVRPLRKTYDPTLPYVVERHDEDDGSIVYEVWDHRPDSYRRVCRIAEDPVDNDEDHLDRGISKRDADLVARALNNARLARKGKSMKAEVVLLIMNLSCADPQMSFREFFGRYFAPVTTPEGKFRWGEFGEDLQSVYRRQLDAAADYVEYRVARAEKCGGAR